MKLTVSRLGLGLAGLAVVSLSACSSDAPVLTAASVAPTTTLPVAAPAVALPTVPPPAAADTTTPKPRTSTTKPRTRCTDRIDYSKDPRDNATINYLGEHDGKCPRPLKSATDGAGGGGGARGGAVDDDLEYALRACQEQTGMSRAECIADSEAGNAN